MTLLLPVAGLLFTVSVIVALHLSVLGAGVVLCVAGMVIGARIDRVLTVVFLVLLLIWLVGGTLFHVGDVPIELGLLVLAGLVQAWSLSIRPDGGTETARDRAMWQMSNVGASCALMVPAVSLLRVDTVDDPGLCFLFGLLGLVGAMFQLDMRASVAPQRISPAGVLGTRYRVLASIVGLALVFGMISGSGVMDASERLGGWLRSRLASSSPIAPDLAGPGFPGIGPSGLGAGAPMLELQQEYDLDRPHHPVLFAELFSELESEVFERLYVTTAVFDQFDGVTWGSSPYAMHRIEDGMDRDLDGRITLTPEHESERARLYTTLGVHTRVPVLSRLTAIGIPEADRYPNDQFGLVNHEPGARVSYDVWFVPERYRDLQGWRRRIGPGHADVVQLPAGPLFDRVRDASREWVAGANTREEQVQQLLAHFDESYTYSQRVRNSERLHPVENFLFSERRGHCELFASAFVLSARSLGIPARLCVGYAGGEYHVGSGTVTYYTDDAHAWAEVQLADGPWVTVDPTPANPEAPPRPAKEVDVAPPLDREHYDAIDRVEGPELADVPTAPREIRFRWALWIPTGLLFVGLAFAIWTYVQRSRGASIWIEDRDSIVARRAPHWFRQFCRHFARKGFPRKESQTISEYMRVLRGHGLLSSDFDEVERYLLSVVYASGAVDPDAEVRCRSLVRALQTESR